LEKEKFCIFLTYKNNPPFTNSSQQTIINSPTKPTKPKIEYPPVLHTCFLPFTLFCLCVKCLQFLLLTVTHKKCYASKEENDTLLSINWWLIVKEWVLCLMMMVAGGKTFGVLCFSEIWQLFGDCNCLNFLQSRILFNKKFYIFRSFKIFLQSRNLFNKKFYITRWFPTEIL
jgi:hypothetical protein